MSWLELLCLVEGLPADSATKAALAGDTEGRRWTQQDWLLTYQINLLQLLIRIQWVAGGIKGAAPDLHQVNVPALKRAPTEQDVRREKQLQQMAQYRPKRAAPGSGDLAALDAALKARSGAVNP